MGADTTAAYEVPPVTPTDRLCWGRTLFQPLFVAEGFGAAPVATLRTMIPSGAGSTTPRDTHEAAVCAYVDFLFPELLFLVVEQLWFSLFHGNYGCVIYLAIAFYCCCRRTTLLSQRRCVT